MMNEWKGECITTPAAQLHEDEEEKEKQEVKCRSKWRVQVSFSPQSSSPHSIHLLFFLLLLREDNSSTRELSLPCAHEMMMMRGGGWEM